MAPSWEATGGKRLGDIPVISGGERLLREFASRRCLWRTALSGIVGGACVLSSTPSRSPCNVSDDERIVPRGTPQLVVSLEEPQRQQARPAALVERRQVERNLQVSEELTLGRG